MTEPLPDPDAVCIHCGHNLSSHRAPLFPASGGTIDVICFERMCPCVRNVSFSDFVTRGKHG